MLSRRRLLSVPLAAVVPVGAAWSLQPAAAGEVPLRLGVDTALADSGLARALLLGFGHDTGLAVQLVRAPALPTLDSLESGELDAALTNTPQAETRLESMGLAYDRRPVADGEFVIVGPQSHARAPDPAHLVGGRNAAQALTVLRDAALAAPGRVSFLSAADGSGAHAAEQTLWRAARIAPEPPWYAGADPGADPMAQARARGAYALVERGAWAARGGAPLAVLVEDDPALAEAVHVLRSFRSSHPAGKLFVAWITGPKGRRIVAAQHGYRAVAA